MRFSLLFSSILLFVFGMFSNISYAATDCTNTAATGVSATDCQALLALYNATTPTGWTTSTNWNSDKAVSTWYGVTVASNRVTQLSLSKNQLTGTLPPEIGNLDKLTKLILSTNSLTGSLPTTLNKLTSLKELILTDNQLSGALPANLSEIKTLTNLNLSTNQLSGSIPSSYTSIITLTSLSLNNNQLTGSIPSEITNLISLTLLNLSTNQFTGTLPTNLDKLVKVQHLTLNSNSLSGTIPSAIGGMTALKVLRLGKNQLTGSLPVEISKLSKLEELNLTSNKLTGSIPVEYAGLTALKTLYVDSNQLSGDSPAIGLLALLQQVTTFKVNNNCLVPTNASVTALLDTKSSGWKTTQTACSGSSGGGTTTPTTGSVSAIKVIRGNNQILTAGSLATEITFQVLDSSGKVVSGKTVNFSLMNPNGTVSNSLLNATSATTNNTGEAVVRVTLTSSSPTGAYQLTASVATGGTPATISAVATMSLQAVDDTGSTNSQLTSLGNAVSLLTTGNLMSSVSERFWGDILVNNSPVTTAKMTDTVTIKLEVKPMTGDIGKTAEWLAVIVYSPDWLQNVSSPSLMLMLTQGTNGRSLAVWNSVVGTLQPFIAKAPLTAFHSLTLYQGTLKMSGTLSFFAGYRLEDGTIVFNGEKPLTLTITP